jgi:hypothetical protein
MKNRKKVFVSYSYQDGNVSGFGYCSMDVPFPISDISSISKLVKEIRVSAGWSADVVIVPISFRRFEGDEA